MFFKDLSNFWPKHLKMWGPIYWDVTYCEERGLMTRLGNSEKKDRVLFLHGEIGGPWCTATLGAIPTK